MTTIAPKIQLLTNTAFAITLSQEQIDPLGILAQLNVGLIVFSTTGAVVVVVGVNAVSFAATTVGAGVGGSEGGASHLISGKQVSPSAQSALSPDAHWRDVKQFATVSSQIFPQKLVMSGSNFGVWVGLEEGAADSGTNSDGGPNVISTGVGATVGEEGVSAPHSGSIWKQACPAVHSAPDPSGHGVLVAQFNAASSGVNPQNRLLRGDASEEKVGGMDWPVEPMGGLVAETVEGVGATEEDGGEGGPRHRTMVKQVWPTGHSASWSDGQGVEVRQFSTVSSKLVPQ